MFTYTSIWMRGVGNNGHCVFIVLLDLSTAFDAVSYNIS